MLSRIYCPNCRKLQPFTRHVSMVEYTSTVEYRNGKWERTPEDESNVDNYYECPNCGMVICRTLNALQTTLENKTPKEMSLSSYGR